MPYPPLGALFACAYLSKLGHSLELFDAMLDSPEEFLEIALKGSYDAVVFYDDEFNYVTKMCLSIMRDNLFALIRQLRHDVPIIVYSSDAIDNAELYLRRGVDYVIYGEGEFTLADLLKAIETGSDPREILGLKLLDDKGKLVVTPRRPLTKELDELPDPDYGLVDLARYRKVWLENHGYFSINISTSRGCTYGCNWCAKPLWGRVYNAFSPSRIANLMRTLVDSFAVEHFWITDDIFGLKKRWLEEFASVCADYGLTVPYKCLSRVDLLLRDKTLEFLKASGCRTIWVGAESGSQKILDAMEKGTTVEQIVEATEKAKALGLEICFFLQFGYLGEQWEDIEQTRGLIRKTMPDDIGISVSYPLPGTKFHEMVQSFLTDKRNWVDSDDLDPLFHGTFPREFYKILHRTVHNEYRFLKGKGDWSIRGILRRTYHHILWKMYERKLSRYRKSQRMIPFQ